MPSHGNFDGSAIHEVVGMFSKRMPYDTIRITLEEKYGLSVSCTTIQAILYTGNILLEPFYENIHNKIIASDIAGLDETTFPINGKIG